MTAGPAVFHEPWWLDAVTPGGWREVTADGGGGATARLPFIRSRRAGLTVLGAPPLTPRLGPLITLDATNPTKRAGRFDQLLTACVEQLPRRAALFMQNLRSDVESWVSFHRLGFRLDPRVSYVIDHGGDVERAWAGFSDSTRNVVRKAERQLQVEQESTAANLVGCVEATFSRQDKHVPYDTAILERIVAAGTPREQTVVLIARDADGRVHGGALVVLEAGRAYYLVGGSDPTLRRSGVGSLLVWDAIQRTADRTGVFDFEGSMVPSIGAFFRSFGGREETYMQAVAGPRALRALVGALRWR